MICDSACAPGESKRHNSTFVALSEKRAKFTPSFLHHAPSGDGRPAQIRSAFLTLERAVAGARGCFAVGVAFNDRSQSFPSSPVFRAPAKAPSRFPAGTTSPYLCHDSKRY